MALKQNRAGFGVDTLAGRERLVEGSDEQCYVPDVKEDPQWCL